MKYCYVPKKFNEVATATIEHINRIIENARAMGFDTMTSRQVYYQFIGHDLFPEDRRWAWTGSRWVRSADGTKNADPNYDWLCTLIADARLAGMVDWDAIVDRTRGLRAKRHYAHPRDIVNEAKDSFHYWLWEDQPNYVEVWVEKDALVDVVASVCSPYDVAYFSCRGFTSVTAMYEAAQRLEYETRQGKTVRIIHLGDHDASGVDMTRDITERLQDTFRVDAHIYRVALNMNQIETYNPPPSPTKMDDSRAKKYIETHGTTDCWELDALPMDVMARIVRQNIEHWCDLTKYKAAVEKQDRARRLLGGICERWNEVTRMIKLPPIEILQQPIRRDDYDK